MLAVQPDCDFQNVQLYLEAGELLMIASADVVGGANRGGLTQDALFKVIRDMYEDPTSDILDHVARMLPLQSNGNAELFDRSLMLVRRRF